MSAGTVAVELAALLADLAKANSQLLERVETAEAQGRGLRALEVEMADQALAAWRSAGARHGLADYDALVQHADAMSRWSERLRAALVKGGEGG